MSFADHHVMRDVRKALGRSSTPGEVPTPPELAEPLVRLVHTDLGLPQLFAAKARENKMVVSLVSADEVVERLVGRVKELGLGSIVVPGGACEDAGEAAQAGGMRVNTLFERLGIVAALQAAGVVVHRWDAITLDATYEVDGALTDAWAGVAETGSVVVRASPEHGRALSLVPAYHIVIVEPRVLLPDLVDLFEKMAGDNRSSGVVIISGPSKTADIEMNLVTGVHGPGHVELFVLK